MRARPAFPVLILAAAAVLAGLAALAGVAAAGPEFGVRVGQTFGVDSPDLAWVGVRDPGTVEYRPAKPDGGVSFGATVLWPWEDRFRFGIEATAVGAGTWGFDEGDWHAAQDDWLRRNGWADRALPARSAQFGALELGQLDGWSASWRMDALGPRLGRLGRSFASMTYGYYLWHSERMLDPGNPTQSVPRAVEDSLHWEVGAQGNPGARQSALGTTLAVGIERALGAHYTIGLTVSATALTSAFTRRFFGAGLEWRWRP